MLSNKNLLQILFSAIFVFIISAAKADEKDSLKQVIEHYSVIDTNLCNAYAKYIELEDNEIWIKHNTDFITLLKKIIQKNSLQQNPKSWYIKKLVVALMYDSQEVMKRSANFNKALEINYEMLKLSKSINDKSLEGRTYNEIGTKYYNQKKYTEALEYFKKSMEKNIELNDTVNLNIDYNNIALTYNDLKKYEEALQYNFKSLEIKKRMKIQQYIALALNNIGVVYRSKGENEKALSYFKQALHINDSIDNRRLKTRNLANITKVLISENKHKQALPYALENYALAGNLKEVEHLSVAAQLLSQVYKQQGNTKKALELYEEHIKMKDSLLNNSNKEALLKTEFKYKNDLKQAEINDLKQNNEIIQLQAQRRNLIWISIVGVLLLIGVLSYFLFQKYKRQKALEIIETEMREKEKLLVAERKALDSELKALKSQMNPHFIFNALNSIQEQFMYGDKIIANEQMGNFTYLTRKILEVSSKKSISISAEIDILEKYLSLEKMRFGNSFNYKITVSEKVDEDYHQILPMLVQPFVENSVKHGLISKNGDKTVKVHFDLDEANQYLICKIIDNGIGLKKSAEINLRNPKKHQSFSTTSIKERLKLLSDKKANIEMKEIIENGEVEETQVVLTLPLEY